MSDELEEADELDSTVNQLLPSKSKDEYERAYHTFMKWCDENEISTYTENVLVSHFSYLSSKYKSSTLMTQYSKLKSTLMAYKNVDIGKYAKLLGILKKLSQEYVPGRKSRALCKEDISRFLHNSPDDEYLVTKIALLMGISGTIGCRQLLKLTIDDIQENTDSLQILVRDSEAKTSRVFYIHDNQYSIYKILPLYKRYMALRPAHTNHRRFFIQYKPKTLNCSVQPMGKNALSKIPAVIARYLGLEDPHLYTGHGFQRSSANILANAGVHISSIRRSNRRSTSAIAEGTSSSYAGLAQVNHEIQAFHEESTKSRENLNFEDTRSSDESYNSDNFDVSGEMFPNLTQEISNGLSEDNPVIEHIKIEIKDEDSRGPPAFPEEPSLSSSDKSTQTPPFFTISTTCPCGRTYQWHHCPKIIEVRNKRRACRNNADDDDDFDEDTLTIHPDKRTC